MAMFLQHCKCNLSVGVGTEKILMQQHEKPNKNKNKK